MSRFRKVVRHFFKDQIFCGLDVGTQKIKACLSRVQDVDNLELLAVSETDTHGLQGSSVSDIPEFSGAITTVLDALARKTKVRIRDVYLGVGGEFVQTRMSRAMIPLTERGNKVICPGDVKTIRRQVRLLGAKLDEEVLCDFVRQFRVDDVNIVLNPVGLYGRKLELEALLVVISISRLKNIVKAVKQAGAEANQVFFNGEAVTQAVLDKMRRMNGAVLVDIGARKTEIFVFKDGLLKHFSFAVYGGDRMTKKIAETLNVSFTLAEDIKRSYVRLSEKEGIAANDEILVPRDQGFVPVRRGLINQAAEEEVGFLTAHIRDAVAASGYEGDLKSGLLMSGGGALVAGLMERVEAAVNMPVAMARNIPGLNNSSLYTVATSLAELGYKGTSRYVFDTHKPGDFWEGLRARAEELCNEYF